MMKQDLPPDEFFDLKNIVLDDDDELQKVLFYGSFYKLEEFLKAADNCLGVIKQSDNVRLIVLETWLFLDYSIRELLISILDLNRFDHSNYDFRQSLLPQSFADCVDLLVKIKQTNEQLLQDPKRHQITFPAKFLFFLKKKYPDYFEKYLEIEQDYYCKYYPELVTSKEEDKFIFTVPLIDNAVPEYSRLSETVLQIISKVDRNWKAKALKLHGVRNFAAHSHNTQKIFERMGYSGENADRHIKKECLELIEQMIGLTPKIER